MGIPVKNNRWGHRAELTGALRTVSLTCAVVSVDDIAAGVYSTEAASERRAQLAWLRRVRETFSHRAGDLFDRVHHACAKHEP